MKYVTIAELYDLGQTIAAELFEGENVIPGRCSR